MPNENHETYGGNTICTYTDDISNENRFSNEQIESYVLSAGVAPYTAPLKLTVANFTHEQCTGGANMYSPFYKESNSNILWYDESGLGVLESDNKWWYRHHVYVSKTGNKIATSLKVQNYCNFLEIVTHTWADIRGTQHKTYYPRITTKYGNIGNWTESVLMPACLICNTTDGLLAKSIGQTEPQSYWYWGGSSNVQNGMGGDGLFTRDLNTGTVTNDSYNVPWEKTNSDPIRIKEGGSDYTFPCAFVGDHITSVFYGGNPLNLHQGFNTIEDVLLLCAFCGLKFEYNNKLYKPLASGGVVYGYTDDMTKTSDWDDWRDIGDHEIPSAPPTPPAPDAGDNEIDVNMQQFSPTQCFVNYIEMSTENMIKLASGFNAYNASIWNIGGDLLKNLVSYKIFAVYGTHSGTIKNVSIGGHEIEYNNAPISGNYIDDMGTVDLGTIEIGSKFRFNDWRDYAPYTKIECFVPCCGWCQLPPWVMGRTVTGTLYIDIANGSCKAVIKAGRTPVAEIGGCVAMDVPFSSVATGAKAAGIITAITNGAVSAFNPTPQNLISGSFGILSSLNANYTETKGVMGDGSNINGCTDFLIKVTRPASTDTGNGQITDRYKHEKGLPCAKTKTLASGQGFTQITDANIDGTMTDREKQMIIDGFRHGLIL